MSDLRDGGGWIEGGGCEFDMDVLRDEMDCLWEGYSGCGCCGGVAGSRAHCCSDLSEGLALQLRPWKVI